MPDPADIQQRVLAAFQQEYREQLTAIRALLAAWPMTEGHLFDEAFRMAHSMKGGARVCDLLEVEKLAHELESLLSEMAKGRVEPTEAVRSRITEVTDEVEDLMTAAASGDALRGGGNTVPEPAPAPPASSAADLGLPAPAANETAPVQVRKSAGAAISQESLRIEVVHLDRLLQSSGQLISESVRQELIGRQLQELFTAAETLRRLGGEAGREIPAEIQTGLLQFSKGLQRVRNLHQKSQWSLRVLGEQQLDDVRRIGMVPIRSVFEGFPKMMRDLAAEAGKKIHFEVAGTDLEADRAVLQMLKDPVMHSLRNAIAHGIESPARRRAAGKPEEGKIVLALSITGQQLQVKVTDDGRGVDMQAVKAQALRSELVTPEAAALYEPEQWLECLFAPRFSTTPEVNNMSGRGVGLSVVKERVTQLQGTVRMVDEPGGGSSLEMLVPVSVTTHRLLLVKAAGRKFALIMRAVAGVQRVAEVHVVEGRSVILVDGKPIPLATLGPAAGVAPVLVRGADERLLVVILKGERPLALNVEEFSGETSAMIKTLPYPASLSPHFSGGILLEDGSIAPVVNLPGLMQRYLGATLREEKATMPTRKKPVILVVDDSFTARTLQKSILEAAGYAVRVAVHGKAALDLLKSEAVDAVVSDVQMPELDGFELLSAMKNHATLSVLPVVLVTSLSSREDQERGLALGADAYIVKERFDHRELLETIRQLV